jgi:hypothetical protein
MGTVLRVLVVVILLLSSAALVFAVMLYGKRELLINRAHMMEDQFRLVAKTIEAADAPDGGVQPSVTAKDTSPVTSKEMDNPERSTFWTTYQFKLETPNLKSMDLDSPKDQLQLRHYYQTVPGPDGKEVRVKDEVNQGEWSTKGAGTMRELLDQLYVRAKKQQETLNKTRVELQKLREELNTTIEEHNKLKQEGRADKKTIDEKNKEIDQLKENIRGLERKIAGLEEEKKTLTAEVAEAKDEITKKKAEIDDLNKKIKDQENQIAKLKGPGKGLPPKTDQSVNPADYLGSPGDKGKVVAVDDKLKFVVVELPDTAMTELIGEQRDRPMPQIEMMIRRPGFKSSTGEFITRIRFRQVLRQKNLVVADILIDWQQSPVEISDVVFF